MTFKEDLAKLVKDAKPGDSISVAIVGTETDKTEYEKAGVNLVVVGKQFVRKCYDCASAKHFYGEYYCILFDCDTIKAVAEYCPNHAHWMSYEDFRKMWRSRT